MIIVAGKLKTYPEHVHALLADIHAQVPATLAEDGCYEYNFALDDAAAGTILVFERWRDAAALMAHLGQPAVAAAGAKWGDKMLGGPKCYDAANEREVGQ